MEPPNNGHIRDRSLVLCREVVPISEVVPERVWLREISHWSVLCSVEARALMEVGAMQASHFGFLSPKESCGPIHTAIKLDLYLSREINNFALNVVTFSGVTSGLSALGGYFCTVATILESASCPLSGVERRSLLGG